MTEPFTISRGAPEACTLPTAEQPTRVAEFDRLFAQTLTGTERVSPTSVRFALTGGGATATQAKDLADRETECCSFFTFIITPTSPVSVVMEVTVPDAHSDVLAALVAMAETATGRADAEGVEA